MGEMNSKVPTDFCGPRHTPGRAATEPEGPGTCVTQRESHPYACNLLFQKQERLWQENSSSKTQRFLLPRPREESKHTEGESGPSQKGGLLC